MPRGTGLTTAMIKSIDWAHHQTVIIIVVTMQEKDEVKRLLHKMLGDILPRKAIIVALHEARHQLLGHSANDVFVDHAVYDVQSEGLREELAWLNLFMKRATR